MSTATILIPEEKRDILNIIAGLEKREMSDILSELIDSYIECHKETLELLSKPEWLTTITQGKQEIEGSIKGKTLDELDS